MTVVALSGLFALFVIVVIRDQDSGRDGPTETPLTEEEELRWRERLAEQGLFDAPYTPHIHRTPPPGYTRDPGIPAGGGFINSGKGAPETSMVFVAKNVWHKEYADGSTIGVWSGREGVLGDELQGVLMIGSSTSGGVQTYDKYRPSTLTGALSITDARKEVLILEAEDGSTLLFDLVSRQFLAVTPTPPTLQ